MGAAAACRDNLQRTALASFAKGSLRFEPGTQYRNSRYGWILLSAAIETAADWPFLRGTTPIK